MFSSRRMRCMAFGLAFVLCWSVGRADAKSPSEEPILTIEPGNHAALPRAVVADERRGVLYSVGDDKTIRVWRLPDLRALDVWRVPAGNGPEGQLFAAALSPNGRHLAAGGWTGWQWDSAASVYVFDTRTGEIAVRIVGLPSAVGALSFTPDGRGLVVGLLGSGGLRVYSVSTGQQQFNDSTYNDKVLGLDVSPDGRVAAVSLDGFLRVYSPANELLGRIRLAEGSLPTRVRFSPSGDQIAIGFQDAVRIGVYDARTGLPVTQLDVSDVEDQANLSFVEWSADGRYLYAGGDPRTTEGSRVFRWDFRGSGARTNVIVGRQRLSGFARLPLGLAFAIEDPGLGIVEESGSVRAAISSGVVDFQRAGDRLRVSRDGRTVTVPLGGGGWHRFSIDRLELVETIKDEQASASDPLVAGKVDWQPGKAEARVNGRVVDLERYEFVRSAAQDGREHIVIGTEWSVRRLDPSGSLVWRANLAAVVWSVRISSDDRFVVAALSDGTVRWLRLSDGVQVLSLFIHETSGEWIAWTPAGYYASSPNGDNFIGWQINRGKDKAADFYRAVQFERLLYRPDVIRAALDEPVSRKTRGAAATPAFDIRQLASIAPPRIRVLDVEPIPGSPAVERVRVRFAAEQVSLPMEDVKLFVDDVPITLASERALSADERKSLEREVVVQPWQADGTLRIEISNGKALGLREVALPRGLTPRTTTTSGELYLLAIGVKDFGALPKDLQLDFSARDAIELSRYFREHEGKPFRKVHTKLLSDGEAQTPTQAAIVQALSFLRAAGPNDTVMLFLASHGVSDEAGNYYFVPGDARSEDICAVLQRRGEMFRRYCANAGVIPDQPQRLVPWQVFFDALGASAGRRILVVDTCEARGISGAVDVASLRKRSAASRFSLLLASAQGEASQEYPPAKHGLFTYALLSSLSRKADQDGDGIVTLQEAYQSLKPTVERLRDPRLGPMTPQLMTTEVLARTPLVAADRH